MIELYPFQHNAIADIERKIAEGVRRILLAAATGAGKTIIASEIIRRHRLRSILFLAHRDELLTQARDKLRRFDVTAGIIKAGRDKDARPQAPVQVAGVQTLYWRALRTDRMEMPRAGIVFVDEAHHVPAMTYQRIIEQYPDAIIIGLTATPCRGDGRGLGNVFEVLVDTPPVAELIKLGLLVLPKIFTTPPPDLSGIRVMSTGDYNTDELSQKMDPLVGDVIEHWLKHSQRRRTVCFAVDVKHSVHLTDEFGKSGVRAEHLDGNTAQAEREAILARLASGETEVVCNVGVLTEGFDCCDIGCIDLARPTRSLGLFRQMIGRGLRAAPEAGKTDCIILDHSGGVYRHGRPDDVIEWVLETDKRAANKTHEARIKEIGSSDPFCECKACGHLRMKGMACEVCGWEPKPPARPVEYIDGQLIEFGKPSAAVIPSDTERKIFYAELRGFQQTARKRDGTPYARGWAANQYRTRHGSFPPWSWNDHPPVTPSPPTLRWIKSRQIAWAKARSA
jgi:superfamily II DNA or RNA helicase